MTDAPLPAELRAELRVQRHFDALIARGILEPVT